METETLIIEDKEHYINLIKRTQKPHSSSHYSFTLNKQNAKKLYFFLKTKFGWE